MTQSQRLSGLARSVGQAWFARLGSSSVGTVATSISASAYTAGIKKSTLKWASSNLQFGLHRHFSSLPPHNVLTMPSLSPTMSHGNITKWKKKEGDALGPGQLIAEVETDKATIDWEAMEEGYVAKILVPDGAQNIEVGAPVMILVDEESDVAAFKNYSSSAAAATASSPPPAVPAAPPAAAAPVAPKSSFPPHQLLTMPALSPTMSMGNIVEWNKAIGDEITAGDLYCDVETDKATMGWEAQEEGFIAQFLVPSGSKEVPIGQPVIVVVEEKELVAAFASFTSADLAGAAAAPEAATHASPAPTPTTATTASTLATPPPSAPKTTLAAGATGSRVNASPLAKKLAAEAGVSLSGVPGSGPGGRVVADDIPSIVAAAKAAPSLSAAASGTGGAWVDIPHTQIRRITASRLLQSKTTVPHYYLSMECQMDNLMALRATINGQAGEKGVKISVNDLIIKASALALKKVPGINASWQPDFIREYKNVDISVAVQTPFGLMVPIVKDADKKGLASISADVKALAAKAKDGKLSPAEFTGGTFTISNLGMYGIRSFAAIINPPQAAILAVGGSDMKVILDKNGKYVEVSTLIATLSCDHRVVDGAVGAQWLNEFKGFLENPITMLL